MAPAPVQIPYHTIVFVTHGGPLEAKSALLAASLRINYLPQQISCCLMEPVARWKEISPETRLLFDELEINIHSAQNMVDDQYPIGNKLSALHAIDAPAIFVDSDMLLMKPFSWHYELFGEFSSKPADSDTFTRHGGQWSFVYDLFDLDLPSRYFKATITKEPMRPYYNAGFISVKNGRTFCEAWIDAARRIDECRKIDNKRPWLDQIALPIAVDHLGWKVSLITDELNYPCHLKQIGNRWPYFAHYHTPSVVENDKNLLIVFKKLKKKFPKLKKILKKYDEWNHIL